MTEIAFASASELAATVRSRQIGCRELLDHYLDRVERFNPGVNAIVTLDIERAQKRADEADSALARGEKVGPLHGVPMTLKDTIDVAGVRTTAGAEKYTDHVPKTQGPVVQKLVDAGAIIFGKTNTPEMASDAQSYNSLFGTTNNPWDHARTPGGSSGGPGAAVAAGLTGFDIGSDVGGSIRHPAHCCGIYGHKPTNGTVSFRGHIPGPPGGLAPFDIWSMGPMARSAEDLGLVLDVIAGPEPEDAIGWKLELPESRHKSIRDFRVAAWLDDPECPVDQEICNRLESLVVSLDAAGVSVDTTARPPIGMSEATKLWRKLYSPIHSPEAPDEKFEALIKRADDLGEDDPLTIPAAYTVMRHRDWLRANEERHQIRRKYQGFFRDFDVLLAPVMPAAAYPHDHSDDKDARTLTVNGEERPYWDLLPWMVVFGVFLFPVTVAPVGSTSDGLPVGVQIVGPHLGDRTTIEFASLIAEVTGGFKAPPGY